MDIRSFELNFETDAFIYDRKLTSELEKRFLKDIESCTEITEEWAAFVMNNRNRNFTDFENALCNFDFKYDIVMGPIANDDLAMLFREYSKHAINLDVLLKELSYKEATNQVSFHTERAIELLRKIGVIHG